MLSRIGIIGDIHAQATRLKNALDFLQSAQVERILCVGDIADGFGDGNRCCELLQAFDVATVAGNHDRWLLDGEERDMKGSVARESLSARSIAWLRNLPRTLRFETVAEPLLLCHSVGDNDMAQLTPDHYGADLENNDDLQQLLRADEFRWMIGGHTHRRMVRRFGNLTVINPGTIVESILVEGSDPCFMVVDFAERCAEFIPFEGHEVAPAEDKFALPLRGEK